MNDNEEIYENNPSDYKTEPEFHRDAIPEPPRHAHIPAYLVSDPVNKKKKKKGTARFLIIALCFSLLGSILGAVGAILVAEGHSPLPLKRWKYLLSQKDRSKETERLSAMNIRKTIMF